MNTTVPTRHMAGFAAFLGLSMFLSVAEGEPTARTWTSISGQTIEATLEKSQGGIAYLKKADGGTIGIPKSRLSPADQKVINELAPSKSAQPTPVKKTAPQAVTDLFGSDLKNAKKKTVSVDELADKFIGVYFSAHWCPPCRAFTPRLVAFHKKLRKAGKPFEIVFVSSDRDRKAMYGYMKEMKMPWLALPYGDKHKGALSGKFNVKGIPKLVILSPTGELITENGRGAVTRGVAAFDEWQAAKK
jgi:thiol-disulfide isomerase/thioredoxin